MEPLPQTEEILERLSGGEALRNVCEELGTSAQAFLRRVATDPALEEHYTRARTACGDIMDSKVQAVADQVAAGKLDPNAGRVAIDAYKWRAAHLQPKRYGDRQVVEHAGSIGVSIADKIRENQKRRPLSKDSVDQK